MTSWRLSVSGRGRAAGALVAWVCFLGLLALPAPAEAGRRIVILDFTGPKAAKLRADVAKVVARDHTLVPVGQWK